jgi:hypothetical protein
MSPGSPSVGVSPGAIELGAPGGGGAGDPLVGISPANAEAESAKPKAVADRNRLMQILLSDFGYARTLA